MYGSFSENKKMVNYYSLFVAVCFAHVKCKSVESAQSGNDSSEIHSRIIGGEKAVPGKFYGMVCAILSGSFHRQTV